MHPIAFPARGVERSLPRRAAWVDSAKGVGIVLVVFGHVWRGIHTSGLIPDEGLFVHVDAAIYLFHMPLFFFLSGLFFTRSLARRGLVGSLGTRVTALLYPLVVWSTVLTLAELLAGRSVNEPLTPSLAALMPFPARSIFWFLWALFVAQTLASLTLTIPAPPGLRPLLGACVGAAAWLAGAALPGSDPWLHDGLQHLPYFLVGVAFAGAGPRPRAWLAAAAALLFLLLLGDATVIESYRAGHLVAGTLCVLCLATALRWAEAPLAGTCADTALRYVGERSMALYLTHILFASGARIMLLAASVSDPVVHLLAGTSLGIAGPLLAYELAERFGLRRLLGY